MRIRHAMTKDPSCCVPSDTAQKAATQTHDTLKQVSAPSGEPSKPRPKSRKAA